MSGQESLLREEIEIEELRYELSMYQAEKEYLQKQNSLTKKSILAHCQFQKRLLNDIKDRV